MTGIALPRMPASLRRLAGWLDRRFAFDTRGNVLRAVLAVAALGAVVALLQGQDANWDLRNYHLHNGYAWLHGRLALDLAPAQMQSYFSPLLDVLHYALMVHWPAPLAGALMGVLHALLFVPLATIAWQVLRAHPQRARLVPLLALAGLCTGAFLSEFAGSMADTTTALPVLAALALLLDAQHRQQGGGFSAGRWLLAGVLLGLAVALKLTNAVYALGLAAAALAGGGGWMRRIGGLALLALAALAVCAVLAGPWYWQVWQVFGNPLLPQFNGVFGAPLAQPVSVADTRWLPHGWLERLAWPLLFSVRPWRVSEIALFQAVWAVLYLLGAALLVRWLLRRPTRAARFAAPALPAVLAFFGVSYLVWQGLFSIHRYLVALEVLAPLLIWVACQRLFAPARARLVAPGLLLFCAAISLGGWNDWGHEPWARRAFTVQAPPVAAPARSTVVLVGGEPQAWRIPFLPAQARYLSVASNFAESQAYAARVHAMLAARPGRYALLPAAVDRKAERVVRMNAWAQRLGLARQSDCRTLRWLVAHGLRARIDEAASPGCRLLPRAGAERDLAADDAVLRDIATQQLAPYGLMLVPGSCRRLSSWIGTTDYPYQWCDLAFAAADGAPVQGSR